MVEAEVALVVDRENHFVESKKEGLRLFSISFLLNLILPFFVFLLLYPLNDIISYDLLSSINITTSLIASLIVFIFFLIVIKREKVKKLLLSIFSNKAIINGTIVVFILFFGSILYTLLITALGFDLSDNSNQENVNNIVVSFPIASFFLIVILAPIVEEFIFRYSLFGGLLKKNRLLAYATSIFAFTAVHLIASYFSEAGFFSELITFFPYAFSGFLFAYIYEKTRNFGSCVYAHILNNFISYFIIVIPLFL